MAVDLSKLNKEQRQAVEHKDGPLLIVAGAGTGKTRTITYRLARLIESGFALPEEILALTFTDKAAGEMEDRVDELLSLGYADAWILTFHAFCERILRRHALDIGIPGNFKVADQTAAWLLARKNLKQFKLKYYKPLGNPAKFIHALLIHFSRCKDQNISPADYAKYAKTATEEKEKAREIARAYSVYQKLLLENSLLDFGDLLVYATALFKKRPAILEKYRRQFKYILADEFQDTNWIQYELLKTLAKPKNNLTVCADDDQCLPPNAKISVLENGEIQEREIKNISKGDNVLTAVGKGHIGISCVNEVLKKNKRARLLTIKTESGRLLTVTDNHKMFCCVPRTHRDKYHYVYLMFRQDIGWRIGVTDDLVLRLRLERSADKILALKAFDNDAQARYHETLWSLKYGIPTSCFKERDDLVIKNELMEKIYKEIDIDSNVIKLARDLNVDLNFCHFCLDAANRGRKSRIIINLQMCYRKYRSKHHIRNHRTLLMNPWIRHRIAVYTSNKIVLDKLKRVGFAIKNDRGHTKKIAIESENLVDLDKIAQRLQRITGGIIEPKFNAAVKYMQPTGNQRNFMAVVMPAKNLVLGHYVPVMEKNEIIYDRIIEIKEVNKRTTVYDLEIDKTHNFIANGIVVHNSIYRWRGASFANILQFQKDFPQSKIIALTRNYRSCQNILDLSHRFIQANNPNRLESVAKIDKRLVSQTKCAGKIAHLHFKTAEQQTQGVANKIIEIMKSDPEAQFSNFAILARANESAALFARACQRSQIPARFAALKGLYSKPSVLDIISYLQFLNNYHDDLALWRIINFPFLMIPGADIARISQHSYKKSCSIYDALFDQELKDQLTVHGRAGIDKLAKMLEAHSKMARHKNVSEITLAFLEDSGCLEWLVRRESREEIDFIGQFYARIKDFEAANLDAGLKNFTDQMAMEIESGEEGKLNFDPIRMPDAVQIMTAHAAKGLEFDYVFIVDLVDRKFPTIERGDEIEIPAALEKDAPAANNAHLEEERRLFYVAMTRARKGIYFASADDYGGTRAKKISRFLREIGYNDNSQPEEVKMLRVAGNGRRPPRGNLPAHFSFTQLATFEKCPLQYKFAHILRVPSRGKPFFSYGKTMHNTLYEFLLESDGNKGNFKMLSEIYKKNWIDEWYDGKDEKESYYRQGLASLKNFWHDFSARRPKIARIGGALALERDFNLKINGHIITGKIDRIDEAPKGIEIIDYKTGTAKDRLRPEDKMQLMIYQIAAQEAFGIEAKKLTYFYLNETKSLSFSPAAQEFNDYRQTIGKIIEKIIASDFRARPGWQCAWCEYKSICDFSRKNN